MKVSRKATGTYEATILSFTLISKKCIQRLSSDIKVSSQMLINDLCKKSWLNCLISLHKSKTQLSQTMKYHLHEPHTYCTTLTQYNIDLNMPMTLKQAFNKHFHFGKLAFLLSFLLQLKTEGIYKECASAYLNTIILQIFCYSQLSETHTATTNYKCNAVANHSQQLTSTQ